MWGVEALAVGKCVLLLHHGVISGGHRSRDIRCGDVEVEALAVNICACY